MREGIYRRLNGTMGSNWIDFATALYYLKDKLTWISSCCTTCIWTLHWAVLLSSRACSLFRCLDEEKNKEYDMFRLLTDKNTIILNLEAYFRG